MALLEVHNPRIGKIKGASPSEDRFYVLILFDISNARKYRKIVKVLKGFTERIQYSVFEGYMKSSQIKELMIGLNGIMSHDQFYNSADKIRVYRMSGNCELTVLGRCANNIPEDDVFV